ncbi:metal-dependent hydrolase [Nocardia wallacei]|uniref:metal-dependent hydrolase n=1 Tax=Nocardia wallacei TaxID=480035 RepID=UPI002457BFFE|nr:metal-dependent hydrolase [Nocardia wallacei]
MTANRDTAIPKARRMRFRFAEPGAVNRYFVQGDMVFSHFVAGLSGGFPAGEESFIRSVRRVSDRLTDPVLKKRVAGFIGQEATHGQEHRRLNDRLVELGYPIEWLDPKGPGRERQIRFEQRLPELVHLAATAAAEHYTAILAQRVLTSAEIQSIPMDPEIRHLLNWHAFEEMEHKSVAFDVFRAAGGTERTRILTMLAMLALAYPLTMISLAASLGSDPVARRRPVTLARQARELFRGPLFRGLAWDLARYTRPGFHPDDIDTGALLEHWQRELFGAGGELVDHVK